MIAELPQAALDRILELPLEELRPLSREEAESYLAWSFEKAEHRRMRMLVRKNSAGSITPEEWNELDRYGRLGTRMGILQSRSRLLLRSIKSSMP